VELQDLFDFAREQNPANGADMRAVIRRAQYVNVDSPARVPNAGEPAEPNEFYLHVSRAIVGQRNKVQRQLNVEERLRLVPEADGDDLWELYAMVTHSGASIKSGHYYSFVKHAGHWYRLDDATVTRVGFDAVRRANQGTNTGVLFFYRRQENPAGPAFPRDPAEPRAWDYVPPAAAQPDAAAAEPAGPLANLAAAVDAAAA